MIFGMSACRNECKKTDCGEHGECNWDKESCVCNIGYEFDGEGKCTVRSRSKFAGYWKGALIREGVDTNENHVLQFDTVGITDAPSIRILGMGDWKCGSVFDTTYRGISVLAKVSFGGSGKDSLMDFKLNEFPCLDSLELLRASFKIEGGSLKTFYRFKYIAPDSTIKFATFNGTLLKQ